MALSQWRNKERKKGGDAAARRNVPVGGGWHFSWWSRMERLVVTVLPLLWRRFLAGLQVLKLQRCEGEEGGCGWF